MKKSILLLITLVVFFCSIQKLNAQVVFRVDHPWDGGYYLNGHIGYLYPGFEEKGIGGIFFTGKKDTVLTVRSQWEGQSYIDGIMTVDVIDRTWNDILVENEFNEYDYSVKFNLKKDHDYVVYFNFRMSYAGCFEGQTCLLTTIDGFPYKSYKCLTDANSTIIQYESRTNNFTLYDKACTAKPYNDHPRHFLVTSDFDTVRYGLIHTFQKRPNITNTSYKLYVNGNEVEADGFYKINDNYMETYYTYYPTDLIEQAPVTYEMVSEITIEYPAICGEEVLVLRDTCICIKRQEVPWVVNTVIENELVIITPPVVGVVSNNLTSWAVGVYALDGKEVVTAVIQLGEEKRFDLTNLAQGVYFVRLICTNQVDEEQSFTTKIVKI